MKILVFGAGATGGYFGGRMIEGGVDATFFVRPARAEKLKQTGLVIKSAFGGDLSIPAPIATGADPGGPYDAVLLSCKAYDLESALTALTPAVGPETLIIPILNGMRHLDAISSHFGAHRTLGGICLISSSLDSDGRIIHHNDKHAVIFGERAGGSSPRVEALTNALQPAKMEIRLSIDIMQEMWDKWVFLAPLAATTCLMRAAVGDVVAAAGPEFTLGFVAECETVARANSHSPNKQQIAWIRNTLTQAGSPIMASMMRDVERGGPVEADHVIGDMIQRGGGARKMPLMQLAYQHLKAYEARRKREAPVA
jgi:2-dehydropantoate 2-reductase